MSGAAPAEARASRGPLLLATGLLVLVLAVSLGLMGETAGRGGGEGAEAYSTFRAGPEGAKAAYVVLERLGYACSRHTDELVGIDDLDVLFVIEPRESGSMMGLIGRYEVGAIEGFVEGGGTLVVASTIPNELFGAFGVSLEGVRTPTAHLAGLGFGPPDEPEPGDPHARVEAVPVLPSAYSSGVTRISMDGHRRRLTSASPTAVPLFVRVPSSPTGTAARAPTGGAAIAAKLQRSQSSDDSFQGLLVRRGRGRALFFADPGLFANRGLARADNAVLLASIPALHGRGAKVAFDEGHHGFKAERGMAGYLGRRSLAPALVQGAVAFAVLIAALGGLAARPRILDEERPPESREHVRAMAEIYAKARLRGHCAQRLMRSLVRDLEHALGVVPVVTPGSPAAPDGLAEELRRRGLKGFRGFERIMKRARHLHERFRPQAIPESALLALAREVGRFEAECREVLGRGFGDGAALSGAEPRREDPTGGPGDRRDVKDARADAKPPENATA